MRRNRRPRCHTHTDTTHASARGLRTPPQDSGRSWAPGGPELRLQAWAVALLVSTSARKRARFIPSLGSGDLGPKPSLLGFFIFLPFLLGNCSRRLRAQRLQAAGQWPCTYSSSWSCAGAPSTRPALVPVGRQMRVSLLAGVVYS